jgi:hypothetical protein
LNLWFTSQLTGMVDMFRVAKAFNQALDAWENDKVTVINGMFCDARSFNQSLHYV